MKIFFDALLNETNPYWIKRGKKPNLAQRKVFNDLLPGFNMMCGGLGSGKTYELVMKMFQLSAINQDFPGGLLAPTIKEFKRDVLPIFQEIVSKYVPGTKYHKTDMYFLFPWSTAPLYIFTAEADIKGPNLAYAGVNEFSSIEREKIQQLINRVRVEGAKLEQIVFVGTPEDEYLWLEEFIDDQTKAGNIRITEVASGENSHLSDRYIQMLRDTMTEQEFKLYALGQRIRLGGKYFYWAYDPKRNDFPVEFDESLPIYANLDFNVGNMSATFAHVIGAGREKQILFFDEIVLTDNGSDTFAMGRAIKERYGTENVVVTHDASGRARKTSGKSDEKILMELGFHCRSKTSNPKLRKRQIMMNGLLEHRNILLNPKKCPKLKRDLQRVEQDPKTFEKIKIHEELTHTSDGADYLCDFEFPNYLDRTEREKFFMRKI